LNIDRTVVQKEDNLLSLPRERKKDSPYRISNKEEILRKFVILAKGGKKEHEQDTHWKFKRMMRHTKKKKPNPKTIPKKHQKRKRKKKKKKPRTKKENQTTDPARKIESDQHSGGEALISPHPPKGGGWEERI